MLRPAALLLVAGLALASCGGHDKAGGAVVAGTRTIEVATQNGSPHYLLPYIAEVTRAADAPTRVKVRTSVRAEEPEGEAAIVEDVRAGRRDFALVSARAFDTLGVDTLAPMLAPLAIDSLEAQQSVLEGDLAARALPALAKVGVVGVALLPGDLRHPLGIARRLVRPADFAGATIGIRSAALARRAFEQLGATVILNKGGDYSGVDGIESDLTVIEADGADADAESLAVDLVLWPRVFVVIANPQAWQRLDPRRRSVLRDAARASLPAAIEQLRQRDAEAYGVLCRRGEVTFVRTTAADAEALRRAFAPATRGLDRAALAEIARLRAVAGPPPAHPPCESQARASQAAREPNEARAAAATPVDGVWTFDSDERDLEATGVPPQDLIAENFGHHVLVFSRGRFAVTQENAVACGWTVGTYEVRGQRMVWDVSGGGGIAPNGAVAGAGEQYEYGWSRFRDTLRLMPHPGAISPEPYLAKPWRRIGDDPGRAPLSRRCPPPPESLQF